MRGNRVREILRGRMDAHKDARHQRGGAEAVQVFGGASFHGRILSAAIYNAGRR
jgi:hypothetical protein